MPARAHGARKVVHAGGARRWCTPSSWYNTCRSRAPHLAPKWCTRIVQNAGMHRELVVHTPSDLHRAPRAYYVGGACARATTHDRSVP